MVDSADSTYTPAPWMQNTPVDPDRRTDTWENYLTTASLTVANGEVNDDQIRSIRPMLAIDLLPPREGYPVDQLRIEDIVNIEARYPRTDFSGRQSGYQGTSYPSLNQF